jgi:hypothetical protein
MSGFAQVAKQLITQTQRQPAARKGDSIEDKLDHIQLACNAGFSPLEIFRDLRELWNDCGDDDKGIKLQISKLMIQVHGMLSSDEVQRAAPQFTLVIQGDNARVNNMLCPNFVGGN